MALELSRDNTCLVSSMLTNPPPTDLNPETIPLPKTTSIPIGLDIDLEMMMYPTFVDEGFYSMLPSNEKALLKLTAPGRKTNPITNQLSSRACDRCHLSKRNCSMQLPQCKRCANLGIPCTYNRPKLRNRRVPLSKLAPCQLNLTPGSSLPLPKSATFQSQLNRLIANNTMLKVVVGLTNLSPISYDRREHRMLDIMVGLHTRLLNDLTFKQKESHSIIKVAIYGNQEIFLTAVKAYFQYTNPFLPLFTRRAFLALPRSRLLLLTVYAAGLTCLPNIHPSWVPAMHREIAHLAKTAMYKPSLDSLQALFIIFSSLYSVVVLSPFCHSAVFVLLPMAHMLGLHLPKKRPHYLSVERKAAYITIMHYYQYNSLVTRSNIYLPIESSFIALGPDNFLLPCPKSNPGYSKSDWAEECLFFLCCRSEITLFIPARSMLSLRQLIASRTVSTAKLISMVSKLESQSSNVFSQETADILYVRAGLDLDRSTELDFNQFQVAVTLHHHSFAVTCLELYTYLEGDISLPPPILPSRNPSQVLLQKLIFGCVRVVSMVQFFGPGAYFRGRIFNIAVALIFLARFKFLGIPEVNNALKQGWAHLKGFGIHYYLDDINQFQASIVEKVADIFQAVQLSHLP